MRNGILEKPDRSNPIIAACTVAIVKRYTVDGDWTVMPSNSTEKKVFPSSQLNLAMICAEEFAGRKDK